MIAEPMDGGICISLSKESFSREKSGKYTPEESGNDLEERISEHISVSAVDKIK